MERIDVHPSTRLNWIKQMALDTSLSHVAFRAGCIVGAHFNNKTGRTFVGHERLAVILGVSPRTAWSALKELVDSGWLQRRQRGDGRGLANEYAMSFKTSQPIATFTEENIAIGCDLSRVKTSQSGVIKVATSCDPTLNLSSKGNSSRGRARESAPCADSKQLGNGNAGRCWVKPGTPAYDAWLAYYAERNFPKVFREMEKRRATGEAMPVPSAWPPSRAARPP